VFVTPPHPFHRLHLPALSWITLLAPRPLESISFVDVTRDAHGCSVFCRFEPCGSCLTDSRLSFLFLDCLLFNLLVATLEETVGSVKNTCRELFLIFSNVEASNVEMFPELGTTLMSFSAFASLFVKK